MAYKTAENLGIYPLHTIVKIGDTVSDIEEGIHAGMWSVGVIMSSNEMGLTQKEITMLDQTELDIRKKMIRQIYLNA
ncbi:MAG: phosphonoacetaldehyde hydrolase, partial [Bacteroidales bacterium]